MYNGDKIMKKKGFIGYGNMGKVILDAFLLSGSLRPYEVLVSTRTRSKLNKLKKKYPEIEIVDENSLIALKSNLIFLFVGTSDVKYVLEEIKEFNSDNTHIVYISAGLTIDNVQRIFNGKITKVMPSLTSKVLEGITLICHNSAVTNEEAQYINTLFNSIGEVKIIDEEDFDIGSEITSCLPAFIADICMKFAQTATRNSGFSHEETEEMVIKTLYGTSKLLYEKNMGFDEVISSVATKGGITEVGIDYLDKEIPEIFNELFSITIEKHAIIKRELKQLY